MMVLLRQRPTCMELAGDRVTILILMGVFFHSSALSLRRITLPALSSFTFAILPSDST